MAQAPTKCRLTVASQDVVPIQATDWWIITERRVRSVVVVEMHVRPEPAFALRRAVVGKAVGPFAQKRLDEAFGFAVRPRRVRSRAYVASVEGGAEGTPGSRFGTQSRCRS